MPGTSKQFLSLSIVLRNIHSTNTRTIHAPQNHGHQPFDIPIVNRNGISMASIQHKWGARFPGAREGAGARSQGKKVVETWCQRSAATRSGGRMASMTRKRVGLRRASSR